MDPFVDDMLRRAEVFAGRASLRLNRRLGFGKDGTVWQSNKPTAVKSFRTPEPFLEEWLADKQEEFGDRWQQAASVIRAFERLGIQLTDIHPGNIAFQQTPK